MVKLRNFFQRFFRAIRIRWSYNQVLHAKNLLKRAEFTFFLFNESNYSKGVRDIQEPCEKFLHNIEFKEGYKPMHDSYYDLD